MILITNKWQASWLMWTGQGYLAGFFTLEVAGFNGMMLMSN